MEKLVLLNRKLAQRYTAKAKRRQPVTRFCPPSAQTVCSMYQQEQIRTSASMKHDSNSSSCRLSRYRFPLLTLFTLNMQMIP